MDQSLHTCRATWVGVALLLPVKGGTLLPLPHGNHAIPLPTAWALPTSEDRADGGSPFYAKYLHSCRVLCSEEAR